MTKFQEFVWRAHVPAALISTVVMIKWDGRRALAGRKFKLAVDGGGEKVGFEYFKRISCFVFEFRGIVAASPWECN